MKKAVEKEQEDGRDAMGSLPFPSTDEEFS